MDGTTAVLCGEIGDPEQKALILAKFFVFFVDIRINFKFEQQ